VVAGSNSYAPTPFYAGEGVPMLDILFFGGGLVLFCLLIAYERLCHRL
jgi:hypothetical protein